MSRIYIELDCKSVVDGMTNNTSTEPEFGTIMDEYCRSLLSSLPNLRIRFTHWQENYVDHSLARKDIIKRTRFRIYYCNHHHFLHLLLCSSTCSSLPTQVPTLLNYGFPSLKTVQVKTIHNKEYKCLQTTYEIENPQ